MGFLSVLMIMRVGILTSDEDVLVRSSDELPGPR